ncbi:unnamed protein product [Symbiodinium natans]|uniref:Uncharacterized protein n=1 Tax=Symbiodinium natans TaxID=878477 RepID=A0A812UWP5_9DINO|nr:unnamed protein product [Symbiodinium natans]
MRWMSHRGCAGIGLCLVVVGASSHIEERCLSSEGSVHIQDPSFLQMKLKLDSTPDTEAEAEAQAETAEALKAAYDQGHEQESALLEQELLDLVRRRIHDEHKDDFANLSNRSGGVPKQLVADLRNFENLLFDLELNRMDINAEKDLADEFWEALLRAAEAKEKVMSAEENKHASLEQLSKLNASSVQAANLTEEVRKYDAIIARFKPEYAEAQRNQTDRTTRMQEVWNAIVQRELNDTRLVQILDDQDLSQSAM